MALPAALKASVFVSNSNWNTS